MRPGLGFGPAVWEEIVELGCLGVDHSDEYNFEPLIGSNVIASQLTKND